jgi:hypothetical protein
MKRIFLLLATVQILTGCAGHMNYTPPASPPLEMNSLVINKPRDVVWDEIIPKIGERFFVINNLEKSSGLINISYNGDPEAYVDCGILESYVKNLKGERTFRFPASSANQQYERMDNGKLYFIDRRLSLEGRMNLIFKKLGENKTEITANTRYVLTRTGTIIQAGSNFSQQHNATINFNSNSSASFPNSIANARCQSTGKFEQDILSLSE